MGLYSRALSFARSKSTRPDRRISDNTGNGTKAHTHLVTFISLRTNVYVCARDLERIKREIRSHAPSTRIFSNFGRTCDGY